MVELLVCGLVDDVYGSSRINNDINKVLFNQHLAFGGLGFAVRIVFQSENVIRVDIMRASARLFRKVVDSVPVFVRFVFRGRLAYLCKMASFFTGMTFFSFGWTISGMGVDTTTVAAS